MDTVQPDAEGTVCFLLTQVVSGGQAFSSEHFQTRLNKHNSF